MQKEVDICCPRVDDYDYLKTKYQTTLNNSIGSITFISHTHELKKEETIQCGTGDLKVRVIFGALPQKDFKILTSFSPIVGCTGNNSIAQALSFGKIPCYHCPGHKLNFLRNLSRIATTHFGEDSALVKYLNGTYAQQADFKKRRENIVKPELIEQAKKLGEIICDYYSVNSILKGMVNQLLLEQADPEFASWLKNLRQEFLDSKINVFDVEGQLESELQKRHLLKANP